MLKNVFLLARLDIHSIKPYFSLANKAIMILIAVSVSLWQMNPIIIPAVFISLGAGAGSTAFFLGEQHRINIFRAALPVKRREIVVGRYALCAFTTLIVGGISFLLMVLIWSVRWPDFFASGVLLVFTLIAFVQYILIISVQFPVYFGAGYAKSGRLGYLSYLPLIILFVMVNMLDRVWDFAMNNMFIITTAALLVSAAALTCSAGLSLRLFERKDL